MKKMRAIAAILVCLLLMGAVTVRAEDSLMLASEAAILMDAETGQVLYEKNANQKMYPASITKIMTAMLALRELNPQEELTVSQSAVDAVPRTSSHIGLLPGETLTVEQAMYAIGMESANDAANVLAEAVSGDLEGFGRKMTEEARALGARNTTFTNANGLPDSRHCTTAYDMALITAAALKIPGLAEYFHTVNYVLPATNLSEARTFANKDRLLPGGQYYYEGVLMAKTGWTTAAQGTFAAAVRRGDTTLVAVVLKGPLLEDKYRDTHKLMDYGFTRYIRTAVSGEQLDARLDLGEYEAAPEQSFPYLMPSDADAGEIVYSLVSHLPEVDEDDVIVTASLGETVLTSLPLHVQRHRAELEVSEFVEAVDEFLEEALETVETSGPSWLLIGGGVVIALYAVKFFHRQYVRHRRRRHLKARIQRMKKQSER